jgi:hypothetical protein
MVHHAASARRRGFVCGQRPVRWAGVQFGERGGLRCRQTMARGPLRRQTCRSAPRGSWRRAAAPSSGSRSRATREPHSGRAVTSQMRFDFTAARPDRPKTPPFGLGATFRTQAVLGAPTRWRSVTWGSGLPRAAAWRKAARRRRGGLARQLAKDSRRRRQT